jgi:hypothetical protein
MRDDLSALHIEIPVEHARHLFGRSCSWTNERIEAVIRREAANVSWPTRPPLEAFLGVVGDAWRVIAVRADAEYLCVFVTES